MANVENVCPQVLRGLSRELRRLAASPPPGVKLLLRDDDLSDVTALIDGPADTPYAGGVFRVRFVLGREYPLAPPRAFFLTRIFHPNVSAGSGEVCVNTLKKDWRPELGLEHALLAVRCLLIAPNADSALNAEAAQLLRDRYDDYFARAKLLADIHAAPAPASAPVNQSETVVASGDEELAKGSESGAAPRSHGPPEQGRGQGPPAAGDQRPPDQGPAAAKRERLAAAAAGGAASGAASGAARPAKDRRRILKRL